MIEQANYPRTITATGAILAWFGVIFQLILILQNGQGTTAEIIIRFISFYTITTNTLIAVCFTTLCLNPQSRWGAWFSKPATLTAIAVYILVVGATYNAILRFIWEPQGLQRIVDETLHLINPLFFLFFWIVYVQKKELQWKNILPWLLYPVVYIIYILIRGHFMHEYPYPFLDVITLGYTQVLISCAVMTALFIGLMVLFVGIGQWQKKRSM